MRGEWVRGERGVGNRRGVRGEWVTGEGRGEGEGEQGGGGENTFPVLSSCVTFDNSDYHFLHDKTKSHNLSFVSYNNYDLNTSIPLYSNCKQAYPSTSETELKYIF